ncbi:unnamed protein product [Nezara viridula]|uniref:Protein kinase domain-containing protein n=1 Tax=Nezara viridula TaxID=85310 RepID=A0A9P0MMH7_NEZVI|nr:unnamed protein product [Nezara viridula]
MGSEKPKNSTLRLLTFSFLRKNHEFSVASLASKFSARSFGSSRTFRSTSSTSRPWSRVSRRIWKDSTLENSYQCIKTAWPVPIIEALFLPEFKIDLTKKHNFEVINVISRGAFGKVYRVMNNDSQEYFALKVLSKSKVLRDNYVSQVKDEVKIQSMCGHHPFIISSPQYWQDRRKLFIVSPYVEGGDLFDLSEKYGALPEELVKIYVAELGSALDFLHNAGVIYRDLKAENILLDSDGHVVLIDFGLSKWLKYGNRTNTLCGTLQYMAPEIFFLNGYGHAVDWWALGTLTVYLLTTKVGFLYLIYKGFIAL